MEPLEGKMTGGKDPESISTKRQRIATLAGRNPKETIYSLAHHMDVEWLHEAYRRTRKDGAPGVDGRTAAEYEQELQGNLERLRHGPVSEQHAGLARKLKGHYGYFGITGNSQSLYRFLRGVERRWRYWLSRRGQRRKYRWDWFMEILKRFPLPEPVVVHSVLRRAANP